MGRSNALRGRWFQPGIPFYLSGTGESTIGYLHLHILRILSRTNKPGSHLD
jgi:hypothetical protein